MTTEMTSLKDSISCLADIHGDKCTPDSQVTIAGWVRTRRDAKKFSFVELNDGTSAKSIQIVVDATLPNYATDIPKLSTGSSARITGKLVLSPGKGQKYEIQATAFESIGEADPETYPLQKKEMTFEYLREVAHFRSRTATFSSVFRIRSRMSFAIHDFFRSRGFYYVHTPILTTSDGEGAGETFKVTTFDLNNIPKLRDNKGVNFEEDFFKTPSMLCVTGQLEAELMALGMGRVYTFGPTFRAENSNTARHLAEFWMIEPEMAFYNLFDTMQLGQDMILHVLKDVFEHCNDDLEALATRADSDARPHLKMALENPFVRVSYTDAVDILQKCGRTFENPVFWGCDLKTEHERFLCETHFKAPTFVYNYPAELKAFYMYLNDDGKTVRATDLLVPGIGEVIGGSQREDREDVLKKRMLEKGIDPSHMDWYLAIRKYGGVPHAGFGLGLERLIMWVTGMANIRDVIAFPRTPGNCKF